MELAIKFKNDKLVGDFWGGLAAMLVALPSAIAFGVTIYASIGPAYAGLGALAGILGATALGLLAPAMGGTNRLITAPCAPAAAVLSAFAIELVQHGVAAPSIVLMLTALGLVSGLVQLMLGFMGIGSLIKYIPFPVVSGYLTGVGLIIIGSQIPKLLGAPGGTAWWRALSSPEMWQWQSALIGAVTAGVMVTAPMLTRVVPAAILGLLAGVLTYFGLATVDESLLVVEGNKLIIGPLGGTASSMFEAITGRWQEIGELKLSQIGSLLGPAFTLAVLLSIDTLKTAVVLDALTRSRHDSNRELIAQGLGNVASACAGGMPGAGQMGATLVNLASGGQTRVSGVVEGIMSLIAFLALGAFIAWIPVGALAGILIVVGIRMIDRHSLHLLESPWTLMDFIVIVAVVAVAVGYSLIAASGVGIALAMFLFIREQLSSTVIRRKMDGGSRFSKRVRLRKDMAILEKEGYQSVILELQGSLFFGTKDQLYTALEPELGKRKYIVLDMRRVQSVDVTAVHLLSQIRDSLIERNAFLIFSSLSHTLPNGRNIAEFFDQMELTTMTDHVKVFGQLDDAVEWVEDQILDQGQSTVPTTEVTALELKDLELFKDHKEETLIDLEAALQRRSLAKDEKVYAFGDPGNELYLIRKGAVRITLPSPVEEGGHHALTYGRGDFFGGMAFLSQMTRLNDATALENTELFVLQREQFITLREEHKRLACTLVEELAKVLALRLRYADKELMAMQE
ncbi:MAG: SulP family inorganic anion transporter [Candidatus Accumulibacter phosphatis]|uniref:Bicarbonate transporter BicA n=4 Tax=Candidatus Accumulibacter TaxID=327159 RepID=A0A080MD88_9PROT|nr:MULTISPECIES: SulP family inorganic anion transporter [Candidatus Accumulibacter]KFB67546.1 MAG: Bicarbonate transporter BicA [Candidatus Accumulibacter vicinus]KFB78445.1 MAG: Bicarbonate transporter BicA [Candidatus Accumulibacter cognatus]MCC2868933.1 cyclic nucleotide-binding domain-containing protein [Candidatus Accumulibacter phosphatis]MCM8622966.1 SulP family inorganic anion transporter [Accumulibacter sp.]MCQ1550676.1 SulP family inorganic anion transporter [Candidatus Accumulibact